MSERTPGPWKYVYNRQTMIQPEVHAELPFDAPSDAVALRVAYLATEEDARLIAAAPELLAACKAAAAWGATDQGLDELMQQLRAAIAKAEGEQ